MDKSLQPLRLLLVEDNPNDAELMVRALRDAGFKPDWHRVDTEAEFLSHLDPDLDLILSDFCMPQFSGLRALEMLNERGLDIPFLLVSGTIGEETAVAAMRSGAADYLMKDRLARLGEAVKHALEQKRVRHERKLADQRVSEQTEIINGAHDAIIIRNFDDQRVIFWNKGAERLYGWTAQERLGRADVALLAEPQQIETVLGVLLSNGEFRGELAQVTKNGHEVIVDSRVTLIRNEDGTPRSVLGIYTDVTEQRKLETQLLRAQRLESIGTLASGVAHDLNNILTPILICAESLRGDLTPGDRESAIALIEESAQRGANVVKQVLTFARGVEGERVSIKPSHLVQEIVDIVRQTFSKSIEITSRCPEDLWSIKGDPTQLHQVMLNVSVNARDAMPSDGKLNFVSSNFEVDEQNAATTPGATPGPHVLIQITDTGGGMPQETIDKIFDPFFTTKDPGRGTGLGLSSAIGIVKSHGGFISVHSEVNKGTTFKIFLPAEVVDQVTPRSETPVAYARGKGELILVVDDEENILRTTKAVLEKYNYRVLTASDGTEALALFARQMDEIKAVLTDISMPHMDGVTTARALRQMKPDLPIIAFTGEPQQARLKELRAMNIDNFLTKPFRTANLLAAVQASISANAAG